MSAIKRATACSTVEGSSGPNGIEDLNDEHRTRDRRPHEKRPIRMLRLDQVRQVTGLGKTKIYELQAEGRFPMRIQITVHSVAWIEDEVQAWLAQRIESSTPLRTL